MPDLTLLDPATLIGRELRLMLERLPGLGWEPCFLHTAEDDEHQILDFAGAAATVPPLTCVEQLKGTSAVVTLGDWDSDRLDHLEELLDGSPETVLVDVGRLERLQERTVPLHRAPSTRPSPPWCRVAHPGVVVAAIAVEPLLPLTPTSVAAGVVESASSFGEAGVEGLARQAAERLSGRNVSVQVAGEVLAFNAVALPAGHLVSELAQLLGDVPASLSRCVSGSFHGHQVHLGVTFAEPVEAPAVLAAWQAEPRLAVMDNKLRLNEVVDGDLILIAPPQMSPDGRVATTIAMADGLRVGGALTALEILQALL